MDEDNGKKWAMPEPVFRHSTGELVAPAEDLYFDPEPDTLQPNSPDEAEEETAEFMLTDAGPVLAAGAPTASAPTAPAEVPLSKLYDPPSKKSPTPAPAASASTAAKPAVEPQPFVSEEFTAEKIVIPGVDSPPKRTSRLMIFVVAVLVLLGIAAGLSLFAYYQYCCKPIETGF